MRYTLALTVRRFRVLLSFQTMSPQTPPSSDAAPDWARPFLDRQLALLGALAESGLEIAVALERQAVGKAGDSAPVTSGDISLAFARVSRAVRQTVALQARLIADRQAFEAGAVSTRVQAAKDRELRGIWAKPKQIERAKRMLWRIAAEDTPDDLETAELIANEAAEQLKDEDLYGDILTRPFSEIIAEICLDLGLSPNWADLIEEPWAQQEIESGHIGAPLLRQRLAEAGADSLVEAAAPRVSASHLESG
jgi:hypothetical protein